MISSKKLCNKDLHRSENQLEIYKVDEIFGLKTDPYMRTQQIIPTLTKKKHMEKL